MMFSVVKSDLVSEKGIGWLMIIIERPYAYLQDELRKTFEGQAGVSVFVDRRQGERRKKKEQFLPERRLAEQRTLKQKIATAIVS